jgi:hypothetical protein
MSMDARRQYTVKYNAGETGAVKVPGIADTK